jgi:hypothetical protein
MKARPAACTASGEICMVVGGSFVDGSVGLSVRRWLMVVCAAEAPPKANCGLKIMLYYIILYY